MQEVYEDTMGMLKVIENVGYVVEVIWHCMGKQIIHEVVVSTRQRRRRRGYSVRGLPILVPLSQQKLCHPTVITQPEVLDAADVSEYFGLMECTVLQPYRLHFPILPYKCGGKLTFPLCRSYVEMQLS